MPSKLTQAEKQRRAGVRMALKVAQESMQFYCLMYDKAKEKVSSDRAECLARVWAAEEICASIRALLAPKRRKRSTVRSALTEQAIQDAEKARKRGSRK